LGLRPSLAAPVALNGTPLAGRWRTELYPCIPRHVAFTGNYSAKFSILTSVRELAITRFGDSLRLQLPGWQHLRGG
jgi:hypothetical protein